MSGFVSVVTWTLNAEAFLVVLEDYFLAAGLAGGWGCLSLPALSVFCVSRRPLLLLARAVYWTGAGPGEGTQRGSAELRTAKQNVSSSVETGTDITILHTYIHWMILI